MKQVKAAVAPAEAPRSALPAWLRSPHLPAMAGLVVLVVAMYSAFLFSDKMLYGSDVMAGLDGRVVLHDALTKYHQFPMWLSSRLGGMPTTDASFADAMYPPSFLVHALFPVYRALGIKIVLHVLLAGVFFYLLLLRGFRMPPLIAFAGAVFYMLNPQFISLTYSGHEGKMFVIAWLPFLVWRMKALMERPGLLNATWLSLGIAMCLLTPHVQMTYFVLWGLFLAWLIGLALVWVKQKQVRSLVPTAVYFWVAVGLGIGLAFVSFYPSYAFVHDAYSVRGVDKGFEFASSWSLHWPEFISLWVPDFCGLNLGGNLQTYWSENAFTLNTEYAGAMPVLLAVLAICMRRSPWRIFWGSIALLAVLFSLGRHTPVFHLAYYLIPGVKKFRACSMMMFWFSFSAVLLAGLCLLDVWKGRLGELSERSRMRWRKGLFVGLGVVTLTALICSSRGFVGGLMEGLAPVLRDTDKRRVFDANFGEHFLPALWLWWLFCVTTLGMVLALLRGKLSAKAFVWAVLVIGIVDVFRIDRGTGEERFIRTQNPRPYFYADPTIAALAKQMPAEPFRCFTLPGALPQNGEGIYGLEGLSGFHDNELRWYRAFRGDQSDRNYFSGLIGQQPDGTPYLVVEQARSGNAFLDLANAKYLLGRQTGVVTIENRGALPRLSFAARYVVLDTAATIAALQSGRYDYRTTVALLQEPDSKPPALAHADSARAMAMPVEWVAYTPNYRKAEVQAPADGFMRISEVFYPGWRVHLDGKPTKIYQADAAWMAVAITTGKHTVELVPGSIYLGRASLVSYPLMVLVAGYWLFLFLRRLRRARPLVSEGA
jgi:hypothetical protein